MSDFLLELRCEEIPARMQAGARETLEKLFRKEMDAAGVALGEVTVWSTPRRLALIARDLPLATAAVSEELKGPRVGAPPQALEGFLRKTGLSEGDLVERDGVLYAVIAKPGRATADVLAAAIPAIVGAFPWPKSMRWGAASLSSESLRWVRPLQGIVAMLGGETVPCEVDGIRSNRVVYGHRFHSGAHVEFEGADSYARQLRECHVIVDHEERQDLIREQAAAAAHAAGLVLVADEGLVVENAGLTEWPVPLLGRFDEAFLDVPPEVIQLTARTNQKYFICREPAGEGEEQGRLANAFVCTANIVALDGGQAIVAGNRKVLAARLSDARFFWEQDQKKRLAEHAEGLARITFHEKLGTVADKVERVAKLAEWLASEGIVPNCNPALARQAAELCKADLVTEMVGEFPELQGVMGGYYARAEGLPDAVADAIRDHYKPVGQGDDVPTAPVTVAVSLADKLDTLVCFFAANEPPTGSKDPFALRRTALGFLRLLQNNEIRVRISVAVEAAYRALASKREGNGAIDVLEGEIPTVYHPVFFRVMESVFADSSTEESFFLRKPNFDNMDWKSEELGFAEANEFYEFSSLKFDQWVDDLGHIYGTLRCCTVVENAIMDFFADRLKVQQREAGVRHDLIDAVFALGGEDDLVRLLARVHA
ncbi:MAG: glycine--tRNA ligase subunit beta, partial [Novosphingobium sp.]|uniref:glycine--tRNA ligase subunit beta n=1 Tax=Novosphingobium sp. TaxID=1874826 RepID=UPI0032B83D3F